MGRTTQAGEFAISYLLGMETHNAQELAELETLDRQGRAMILQLQRSTLGLRTNGIVLDRLREISEAMRQIDAVYLNPVATMITQPDPSTHIDLAADAVVDLRFKNALDDRDQLMLLRESRTSSAESVGTRWG